MEDREFFDTLLQLWSKTTGAKDHYWMPEEDQDFPEWNIYAVNADNERVSLGEFLNEIDADFITAVHGCLPDLVRRLHDALDEADRVDEARDEAENRLASEILRNMELEAELAGLRRQLAPPF